MKIEWVNHAGFVLISGDRNVLVDPWIEGTVFDDGWSLLAATKFGYEDFDRITDIWFSHEHPDHFSPPNLRKIPPWHRSKIRVLFRKTPDRRVVVACIKLGFAATIDLPPRWQRLNAETEILCRPWSDDSWIAFRTVGHTLLNLNDCISVRDDDLLPLKQELGRVDTLITQFSYANWQGNEDDADAWKAEAARYLAKIKREIAILQPKFVVLSASFVYFCHEENWFMNRWCNRIDETSSLIAELGATPIVLYPGDVWDVGTAHDSTTAIKKYETDLNRVLRAGPTHRSRTVTIGELQIAAREFVGRLRARNSRALLWRVDPTYIRLKDHSLDLKLSLAGLQQCTRDQPADVALSSSALLFCLKNDFGGETLSINGRLEAPRGGDRSRFFRWFSIARANSHGTTYDLWHYLRKLRAG